MRMVCTCTPCRDRPTDSCSVHQYRTNVTCSGTKPYDEACDDCSLCNAGEYVAGIEYCSGRGFVDATAGRCRACRVACPAGHYVTGECVTGQEMQDKTCKPCRTSCPVGYYLIGRCDGTAVGFDTTRCVPCDSCQPGQYQVGVCDGTTNRDTTLCAPCNHTSCKPFEILTNQCTGMGFADTSRCVPCSDSTGTGCAQNQFMRTMCSASSLYDGVCANCRVQCSGPTMPEKPTGEYRLVPCNGRTDTDLVCAPCQRNCPAGEYVDSLCDGTTDVDTTVCTPCACPEGHYAPNNTCTGNTTSDVLQCVPCTLAEECPAGEYLAGVCSTFSNPRCVACRTPCREAEVEARPCENGENRVCLPDDACFRDCPRGTTYESRACQPPRVTQVCSNCTLCAKGYFVEKPCGLKSDTVCKRCTPAICADDAFNAQFTVGATEECQGTEAQDVAECGVVHEGMGETCPRNFYRTERFIPLPQLVPSSDQGGAFDVHPNRSVYALCTGKSLLLLAFSPEAMDTYGPQTVLRNVTLPPGEGPCMDVRFAGCGGEGGGGECLYVALQGNSSNLFKCSNGSSSCIPAVSLPADTVLQGFQVLDSTAATTVLAIVTSAALYRVVASQQGQQSITAMYTFPGGVQAVAGLQPAYDARTKRLYVLATASSSSYRLYEFSNLLAGQQAQTSWLPVQGIAANARLVGLAVRSDTGSLSVYDQASQTMHVLACTRYDASTTAASCGAVSEPSPKRIVDMEFVGGLDAPKQMLLTWSDGKLQLHMYVRCARCRGGGITENEEEEAMSDDACVCPVGYRIVTYPARSCERCKCAGETFYGIIEGAEQCSTGRDLSPPVCLACSATCGVGHFIDGACDGTQYRNEMRCVMCTYYAISMGFSNANSDYVSTCPEAGTAPLGIKQSASEFRRICTEDKGLDCMRRQALMYPFDGMDLTQDLAPMARNLIPVSASRRSQGPSVELLSGAKAELEESADPLLRLMTDRSNAWHRRMAAARMNATNHEYYRIPPVLNLFDPTLAVRVMPNSAFAWGEESMGERKIPNDVAWEQGMTLCLWFKFGWLNGAGNETLFEMGNGVGTENFYVRRHGATLDLEFGVSHSMGKHQKVFRTVNGSGIPAVPNVWRHVCWTVRHVLPPNISTYKAAENGTDVYILPENLFWSSLPTSYSVATSAVAVQAMASYRAVWSIYLNGGVQEPPPESGQQWVYENIEDGVMPVDGAYSVNYVGYGSALGATFFTGSFSDLRLYERPLDRASVASIFMGERCCSVFAGGGYVDSSELCNGKSRYNTEFCRACKTDCGPFYYVDNEDFRCKGRRTGDYTLCYPCRPCDQDQYISQLCSGTSFIDEAFCPPCKYSTTDQCPAGHVLIGRCDGNQIYDTSSCVPCNAQCISAAQDPQGKGQFIERACWFNELDYRCRPCTGRCPVGSFITAQCSGKGRTDTGCTFCRSFCQEGLIGVYQKHGQYISGRCDGTTFADEQVYAWPCCFLCLMHAKEGQTRPQPQWRHPRPGHSFVRWPC